MTITQLDPKHYYITYDDGSTEVISTSMLNFIQNQITKYTPILTAIQANNFNVISATTQYRVTPLTP